MPNIAITNIRPSNLGVYSLGKEGLSLVFDASPVKGCQAVGLEISKPNFFFEGLSEEQSKNATMTTLPQGGAKGHVIIPRSIFASPGYYEVCAVCMNGKGKHIGERSDVLTIIREQ